MRLPMIALMAAVSLAASFTIAAAGPLPGSSGGGAALIRQTGCGSCHVIPGIPGAQGLAGPPLDHMVHRIYIAGMLRNTPENMTHWIMHPQSVVRGNAMPEMGLTESQAKDIAAYLALLD